MFLHDVHQSRTVFRCTRAAASAATLLLCALTVALVLLLPGRPAAAQILVYDSTANPITPAATLTFVPSVNKSGDADDYQTILAGSEDEFLLTGLSFFGGPIFDGAPNGTNNVLQFRFLNQFGGIPDDEVEFQVAFENSGSFLYNIGVGANGIPVNAFVPTNGILEVTTLTASNAVGTWAFTNTPPSVGTNNAGVAGIRTFALSGITVAPEPSSVALLLLAGAGVGARIALARRRKS